MRSPFEVHHPTAAETPVVVEVPHAGLAIDPRSAAFTIAPVRSVGRDADLFVDRLYERAPELGATTLVAGASRFVLDLNRGPLDFDGVAVEGGGAAAFPRGLVWRLTTEGEPILGRRLPRGELERRMRELYDPYHTTLRSLLDAKVARFGFAILLCGHSMPSRGRRGHADAGTERVDVVPGSRGRTSAAAPVIDLVDEIADRHGLSVRHDDPYKGGFSTASYGRPRSNVHALQIELARRLYMDEDALALEDEGFLATRGFTDDLVQALGALDLRAPGD